jgi:hypothetical protein
LKSHVDFVPDKSLQKRSYLKKEKNSFAFYGAIASLVLVTLLGIFNLVPLLILKPLIFVLVIGFCLFLDDSNRLKLTIFIIMINALQRRVMSGNLYYITNDYLIALPFIPMIFMIGKNLKLAFTDKVVNFLIYILTFLTIFSVFENFTQVGWGYTNLVLILLLSKVSLKVFEPSLVRFVVYLGVLQALILILQRINMQPYDIGWCITVRNSLVINEICGSDSPRLWGSMESAINAGCFLATTVILLLYLPVKGRFLIYKYFALAIMFVGLFLTGSRSFLLLIPVVILLVSLKRRTSVPSFLVGILLIFVFVTSLPLLATALNYSSRWTERLNFQKFMGDASLAARLALIRNISEDLTLKNIVFGSGIATKSRGVSAIDNGFYSMMIEIGLPLMVGFLLYIIRTIAFSNKLSGFQFSVYGATLMLFLSNLSFAVFTGSSAFLFWIFLVNISNSRRESG